MTEGTNEEVPMAECGACRSIVPLDSENCPECGISFSGVSDESLGECGACHGLVALDSTKCIHCGTIFVADDVVEVLRKWLEVTGIDIPTLFKKFDTNGDNLIDSNELKTGLLSLNLADLPPSQVERLVKTIDDDGDGQIDLSELHETITGQPHIASGTQLPTTTAEDSETDDDDDVDAEHEAADTETIDTSEDDVSEDESNETSTDADDELEEISEVVDDESDTVTEEDDDETEHIAASDFGDDETDDVSDDFEDDVEHESFNAETILQMISDAMDEAGESPNRFFHSLDKDGNGYISAEEFTESIAQLLDTEFSHKDIESFLSNTDEDNDGSIDIIEFVEALESLDDTDEAIDDEARLSDKVDKPFPTDRQKRMMGKQWNDVVWPLIHLFFGLFIAAWLINGMGGIGPLAVSGEGGNIPLETAYGIGYESYAEGDIYPCEPDVQVGECRNSLTPLSGDASSMPAGFYWDGILMMVLGLVGLCGSLAMHFVVVPGWRARAKAMKEVNDDVEEARSDDSAEDESEDDNEEEAVDEDTATDSETEQELDGDDDVEYEDDDEEIEEHEDDEGEDDEIDIGSHIGLAFEDEEVFGTIVEFDDEEETVTIEEDGTGDLVTGYQEDIFLE